MQRSRTSGLLRILAVAAFVIVANPGVATSASAVAAADIFERFGLLGFWSPNCSAPASRANPRVIWSVFNGMIVHSVSFDGRTVALFDTIASAEILNDHDLRLSHTGSGNFPAAVVLRLVKDRVWTIYSAGANGHVFYNQGIDVSTGKPSLIDERCELLTS